jgi:tetraacyldisaccharide 4'-kinase
MPRSRVAPRRDWPRSWHEGWRGLIPMKNPGFWITGGLPARLLSPLQPITAAITARRVARQGWRAPVPVFCVGNATVGGTGKTPLVLDLAVRLLARGVAVHILTRGYGGASRGPLLVDSATHTAAEVGDEALLLAAAAPCWIGADRAASARAAVAAGAAALLLDDGLQNPSLIKDFCVLVIDGSTGFGNERLLPAGPLREPVMAAAARCQIAAMIGADRTSAATRLPAGLPVRQARLASGDDMCMLAGQTVFAFAGIGRPQKFFLSLLEAGIALAGTRSFADHHVYAPRELAALRADAASCGAPLVTTMKDFVRLPAASRSGVTPLGARLAWANEASIDAMLADALLGAPA